METGVIFTIFQFGYTSVNMLQNAMNSNVFCNIGCCWLHLHVFIQHVLQGISSRWARCAVATFERRTHPSRMVLDFVSVRAWFERVWTLQAKIGTAKQDFQDTIDSISSGFMVPDGCPVLKWLSKTHFWMCQYLVRSKCLKAERSLFVSGRRTGAGWMAVWIFCRTMGWCNSGCVGA